MAHPTQRAKRNRRNQHGSSPRLRVAHIVRGMIMSWTDRDPFAESDHVDNAVITHRNPILRPSAQQIYRELGRWFIDVQPFRWLVTIQVIFDYPNGQTQIEERELEAFATISQINAVAMEEIRDAQRHGAMEHYRHTAFRVECLGNAG